MLKAPFPYFGGKSKVAHVVWEAFGDVRNYVEPFCGSLAMLLGRPAPRVGTETVNDADGLLANFWRSVKADPDATAHYADWPVSECDLHARHLWLCGRRADITARLMGDPGWCDAKAAGWWVWGQCAWIGGGWCSGEGPWVSVGGVMVDSRESPGAGGTGVRRVRPALNHHGAGVHRKRPHLNHLGSGVHSKMGDPSPGDRAAAMLDWFRALADRLRLVRVCCGGWERVTGRTPTTLHAGVTGVFLDPPYSAEAGRDNGVYATESKTVAHDVREWAIERGGDPKMRIALCGYEGEHDMPGGWREHGWRAHGGFGNRGDGAGRANKARERVWFSPHCLRGSNAELDIGESERENLYTRGASCIESA